MKNFLDLVTKNIPLTILIIIGIILLVIVVAAIIIKVMKPTEAQKQNLYDFLENIRDELKEKVNLALATTNTNYLHFAEYQADLIQNIKLNIAEHIRDSIDNCIEDPNFRKVSYKILNSDFVEEFAAIIIKETDVLGRAESIFDNSIKSTIEAMEREDQQDYEERMAFENGTKEVDDFDEENFVDEFTAERAKYPEEIEIPADEDLVYDDLDDSIEVLDDK